MAATTGPGVQRRIDWPVAPSDPDAWLPVLPDRSDIAADDLMEAIEDAEVDVRFVPDWTDEPIRNAA